MYGCYMFSRGQDVYEGSQEQTTNSNQAKKKKKDLNVLHNSNPQLMRICIT